MANLWGGRFSKETAEQVFSFNASLSFDKRLFRQDIEGSIAHVVMLEKQKVLPLAEKDEIVKGLVGIRADIESGALVIEGDYEDIHSFVEGKLIERIGEVGKKLHTGRSRNDQVAVDMKMYFRAEIEAVRAEIHALLRVLLRLMQENVETYMPGFTHLQKAQPTTMAHHLGAYFEMFLRDSERLNAIYKRMNYCPLGAGAFAGTTYPLDRFYTASMLGFEAPARNSMDAVADRDYLIESLAAFATIMMHLSRFAEEIVIWNSGEYRFIELDDGYCTGSSIMPQKKNPDIAELVRGKTARVYGALNTALTMMKGLPLAYNKDMQEDKEAAFDAVDTVKASLTLFGGMLDTMAFNREVMAWSAVTGFTNATDAADYLVGRGMPFRDAHAVVGKMVLYCLENDKAIADLSIEEMKEVSPCFEADIYEAISLKACVERRTTYGGPAPTAMRGIIKEYEEYLRKITE
jgi:argininosuccinate lyase